VAATETLGPRLLRRLLSAWRAVLSGLLAGGAASPAGAVVLPEDKAEAIYHRYDGGGVKADGPAFLVRKSLADRVSLSAGYYIDAVSNASIDVVTTASPFKETRTAYDFGADYIVRDSLLSLSVNSSREPDYTADTFGFDVSQDMFGGMTSVNLGFSRARDQVGKKNDFGYFDQATHWQYRAGVTQILSPSWLASVNFEAISDDGFLGSPYRSARVFGAAVPERNPRTRSSRAVKLRAIGDVGSRTVVCGEYRYYWDTWDVKAQTAEFGASRYFGESFLGDVSLRFYSQNKALFYSDNATSETLFISRNRQLSTFKSTGIAAKLTYTVSGWLPARYGLKVTGAYELKQFRFSDFTDLRSNKAFSYNANVLQLVVTATF
jgi:hypothetical protein